MNSATESIADARGTSEAKKGKLNSEPFSGFKIVWTGTRSSIVCWAL